MMAHKFDDVVDGVTYCSRCGWWQGASPTVCESKEAQGGHSTTILPCSSCSADLHPRDDSWIGFDLNPEYAELAKQRTSQRSLLSLLPADSSP